MFSIQKTPFKHMVPPQLARIRWANVGNGRHRRRPYSNVGLPTLACQRWYNVAKGMLYPRWQYSQWFANVGTTSYNSCHTNFGRFTLYQRWQYSQSSANVGSTSDNSCYTNVGPTLAQHCISNFHQRALKVARRYLCPADPLSLIIGH